MYNTGTIVNNIVLCPWNLPRSSILSVLTTLEKVTTIRGDGYGYINQLDCGDYTKDTYDQLQSLSTLNTFKF